MSHLPPSLSLPLASSRAFALGPVCRSVPVFVPLWLRLLAGVRGFRFAAHRLVVSVVRRALRVHHPSSSCCALAPSGVSFGSPLLLGRAGGVAKVGGVRSSARRGSPVVPLSRAPAPKTWQRWSP